MRNRFLTLVAATLVAACGHKTSQSSEASAAEVSTTRPESSVATPPASVVTGPVSFDEGQTAFAEKRYGDAVRLFTAYTSDKPDNVWGYYMLGLSAWKAGDRDAAVNAACPSLNDTGPVTTGVVGVVTPEVSGGVLGTSAALASDDGDVL